MYFKNHNILKSAIVAIGDIAVIGASFLCAYVLRADVGTYTLGYGLPDFGLLSDAIASLSEHAWLLIIIVPLWEGTLVWAGVFRPSRTSTYFDTAWTAIAAIFLATGLLGGIVFALKLEYLSRGFIVLFALISAVGLAVDKCLLILMLKEVRRRDRNLLSVLVVGTGPRAQDYIRQLHNRRDLGLRILGLVDYDRSCVGSSVHNYKVIGTLDDIPHILATNVVDLVTFAVPRAWIANIDQSIRHCEIQGVSVQIALDLFSHDLGRMRVTKFGGIPMLALDATVIAPWQAVVKRAIDILVSSVALILLAPLFAVIAIAIKVNSRGPVFFRQLRSGLQGREFQMLKFRSMVSDAELRLQELQADNEMSGAAFKVSSDPRVTSVGKFLRRFSLDELPQFVNVLRGEMSLVGPRPLIASEISKYEEWQRRRMSVRPGLTCLWQINGRSTIDFENWMKLDLEYIDNWSILMDLRIIAKTFPALMYGRGAY